MASDHGLVMKLDVTQPEQVAAAVKAAEARFGGTDMLVNNADIGYVAAIEEGDAPEVRKSFRVWVPRFTSGAFISVRSWRS